MTTGVICWSLMLKVQLSTCADPLILSIRRYDGFHVLKNKGGLTRTYHNHIPQTNYRTPKKNTEHRHTHYSNNTMKIEQQGLSLPQQDDSKRCWLFLLHYFEKGILSECQLTIYIHTNSINTIVNFRLKFSYILEMLSNL